MRKIAFVLVLCVGAASLGAQTVAAANGPQLASSPHAGSSELHRNALALVELLGIRKEFLNSRQKFVDRARQEVERKFPNDHAFVQEFMRRVEQQVSMQDYVNVVVAGFEQNFTNQDLLDIIQAQREMRAGRTPTISPRLQAKVHEAGAIADREISDGFAQLANKLSVQIRGQIAKENPELLQGIGSSSLPLPSAAAAREANPNGLPVAITPADSENSPDFAVTPAN